MTRKKRSLGATADAGSGRFFHRFQNQTQLHNHKWRATTPSLRLISRARSPTYAARASKPPSRPRILRPRCRSFPSSSAVCTWFPRLLRAPPARRPCTCIGSLPCRASHSNISACVHSHLSAFSLIFFCYCLFAIDRQHGAQQAARRRRGFSPAGAPPQCALPVAPSAPASHGDCAAPSCRVSRGRQAQRSDARPVPRVLGAE